ncbi:unnamed protein product [Lupinus luteus]|uniref:Uncharacterized protein n=1 Tax=Lupinus luteus TaxID=3873 RepID=A0AAV1X1I1_LUPLU
MQFGTDGVAIKALDYIRELVDSLKIEIWCLLQKLDFDSAKEDINVAIQEMKKKLESVFTRE